MTTSPPRRPPEPESGAAVLLIVGDLNLQDREDPAAAFEAIEPTLRASDVLFGHLEGPYDRRAASDLAEPAVPHKPRWRHSEPRMVEGLKAAGFAAVSCASNVTYPRRVALTTREVLDEAGIPACGVGRDRAEARRPAIVTRAGVRFGFLSVTSVFWPTCHAAEDGLAGVATMTAHTAYGPGPRALEMPGAPPEVVTFADTADLDALTADIRALRQAVDVVVVSCHWGVSGSSEPMGYQREVGRAAIDAGADLVVGHHPHVLQEVEAYGSGAIFYSLGNFAFDWEKMRGRHLDGIIVRCVVRGGRVADLSFAPVRRDDRNLVAPVAGDDPLWHEILADVIARTRSNGTLLDVGDGRCTLAGRTGDR